MESEESTRKKTSRKGKSGFNGTLPAFCILGGLMYLLVSWGSKQLEREDKSWGNRIERGYFLNEAYLKWGTDSLNYYDENGSVVFRLWKEELYGATDSEEAQYYWIALKFDGDTRGSRATSYEISKSKKDLEKLLKEKYSVRDSYQIRPSENPTAPSESAEPSGDTAKPPPAEPPVAESPSEEPSVTLPLSDADVERLLKEAVEFDSLQERGDLRHQVNESEPFSGWAKKMWDSGQVEVLVQFKDGKYDGRATLWHENGKKSLEATFKDGEPVGLATAWHENGQKKSETTYKDGESVSQRSWPSNGGEGN